MIAKVFVYGTLLPGEKRWPFLQPFVDGDGRPDAVVGELYDAGVGYPAAVFDAAVVAPEAAAGCHLVRGQVFRLRGELLSESLRTLDEVESTADGAYRRVEVTTRAGIVAWAYEYTGDRSMKPIASGSWLNR